MTPCTFSFGFFVTCDCIGVAVFEVALKEERRATLASLSGETQCVLVERKSYHAERTPDVGVLRVRMGRYHDYIGARCWTLSDVDA